MLSGKFRVLSEVTGGPAATAPLTTVLWTFQQRHAVELFFQVDDTVGPGTQVLNVTLEGSVDNVAWTPVYFYLADTNIWDPLVAIPTNPQAANSVELYWTNFVWPYMRVVGSRALADAETVLLSRIQRTSL